MKLIEGTVYEKWPLLLFTPFAVLDISSALLWNSYIDGCFAMMQHMRAPAKPMGDSLLPEEKR